MQAFIFFGRKKNSETICRMFNIDPTVLSKWIRAYTDDGSTSLGLEDHSKLFNSLTDDQPVVAKAICHRQKVDALV